LFSIVYWLFLEILITPLFSSTTEEHFFWPFVFINILGATFIFNIFLCW